MRTLEQLRTVRIGDMTPEERRLVTRAACERLKAELESPAMQAHLRAILED